MKRIVAVLCLTALLLGLAIIWGSPALALTEEETKRAETLIPLLEGDQEFWAIGEFVHLGPQAVPVLMKALQSPSRRIRLNAIEALSMIKDKSAVPALNAIAGNAQDILAVREKALRVAIRLDPQNALPALQAMAKDQNEAIRQTVVHESRYVRDKGVIDLLITMLADDVPSVADGALRTLYGFTGRVVERQDFLQSTKEQRVAWSKEWAQWWEENKEKFNFIPKRAAGPAERKGWAAQQPGLSANASYGTIKG
jgi:HEAT repeat protein